MLLSLGAAVAPADAYQMFSMADRSPSAYGLLRFPDGRANTAPFICVHQKASAHNLARLLKWHWNVGPVTDQATGIVSNRGECRLRHRFRGARSPCS